MIKSEFIKLFKSKKTWLVFITVLVIAVADSCLAIYESKPEYVDEIYGLSNPAYFSLISGNKYYSLLTIFFYMMPIFLMLAYCDTYVKERKNGITLLQHTKIGRKKYFSSKTTVAFLFPFVIMGIPNLINILINTIFLWGGTNFSGLQVEYTREQLGELMYRSINHPYTTYFIFLLMNLIVYGLLSVMCQSLCFIFKDNRIVYLLSLAIWIGLYFSSRKIGIAYVLQPFLSINIEPIIYSFLAFLPSVFIPLAIAYYCMVHKKDEI